jgi:hypothetical protein
MPNSLSRTLPAFLMGLTCLSAPVAAQNRAPVPAPPPIADNSFLLEEAFNQEAGVVQHISVFQHVWDSGAWAYAFTQEWPLWRQRHQLSYTVPVQRAPVTTGSSTGLGDIAVNYRFQLVGTEGPLSVSPRVSLVIPTGDEARGFGAGAPGVQFNLPISISAGPVVTHWNAGGSHTPSARDGSGARAAATGWNLGASVIWLARPTINLVLETAWARTEAVVGPDQTVASESWVLNPGVRWAHNFRNGLQIVPGVAFPIGIGPSSGDWGMLIYVSFEHPF